MSGTFKDMNVPPTLVSFAVATMDVNYTVSSEFKKAGSKVVLIPLKINENGVPDFAQLDKNYAAVHQMIMNRKVLAAHTVRSGGISEAISKMCFGT